MTTNNHTNGYPSNLYQKFIGILTQSGMLLMLSTAIALLWANSPWRDTYDQLWHHTYFTVGFDNYQLHKHLIHWINDGLMAIFFFVVGLEIKREIIAGELKTPKKAALPFFAALGGMLVPVLVFKLFGIEGEGAQGWGIPMATDIAFSIAVLAMLRSRVPLSLKIFLTALAIVDDLGAVLVIAFFYTSSINWTLLIIGMVLLAILFALNKMKVQNLWAYTSIGFVIWLLFLYSGVHATIAGVLVAFTIPVYPKVKLKEFSDKIKQELDIMTGNNSNQSFMLNESQMDAVDNVQHLVVKVQSPLQRIEHDLGRLVNYAILPIFALANAGVFLGGDGSNASPQMLSTLGLAIAMSLIFGKAIGISLFSWLAVKLKLAEKPAGIDWTSIIGVGFIGGIGFTMSLFITTLAYQSEDIINEAKIGIFLGSIIAGLLGFMLIRLTQKPTETKTTSH